LLPLLFNFNLLLLAVVCSINGGRFRRRHDVVRADDDGVAVESATSLVT
jgi:hypothetical protein